MQSVLSLALAVYIVFYALEGAVRYGLHIMGHDALIFTRDALLIAPLAALAAVQFMRGKVHPAYAIFLLIIAVHGMVMILNIGSVMAVAYSAKMLVTLLAGAVLAGRLMRPGRGMVMLTLLLWTVTFTGVALDKYYTDLPWTGMETTIDDIKVEISRDWQITGEDKRAGGFTRSSINAATLEPLLALILMFNLRSKTWRSLIALLTLPVLFWTTQKGPLIAYALTLAMLMLSPKSPVPVLRLGVWLMLLLAVGLPIALSGMQMPAADGVFSFSSFYQRIEQMWPQAWQWIRLHEAFPFGVGLGGISGAQRLYDEVYKMNAADNVFILMYAYFGVMSFVYLGFIGVAAWRAPAKAAGIPQAMATLVYLLAYGCVISLLEDQMASLFLGASVGWICTQIRAKQPAGASKALVSQPRLVRA